jgi:hypothetical protein
LQRRFDQFGWRFSSSRPGKAPVGQGLIAGWAEGGETSAPGSAGEGAAMSPIIAAAQNTLVRNIFSIARVLTALACYSQLPAPVSPQIVNLPVREQFQTHHQHFSCTMEYPPAECVRDLERLQLLLQKYHAGGLGEWQWVVVSRSEWKPFCTRLGVDFASPAMTSFLDRQTFLDQALFAGDLTRANELLRKFGVPWNELLPLALTHELGHAVCRDVAEARAEFYAGKLRQQRPGRCDSSETLPIWSFPTPPPGR